MTEQELAIFISFIRNEMMPGEGKSGLDRELANERIRNAARSVRGNVSTSAEIMIARAVLDSE